MTLESSGGENDPDPEEDAESSEERSLPKLEKVKNTESLNSFPNSNTASCTNSTVISRKGKLTAIPIKEQTLNSTP